MLVAGHRGPHSGHAPHASFGTPLGMLVFGPLVDMIDVRLIFIIGGALTIPLGCWLGHVGAVTPRADAAGQSGR